jgi:hypothetical protein
MSALNEDFLVQQTTADYLRDALGWTSILAYNDETFGLGGTLVAVADLRLGRLIFSRHGKFMEPRLRRRDSNWRAFRISSCHSQIKRRAQNKPARLDDPVGIDRAVGIGGTGCSRPSAKALRMP